MAIEEVGEKITNKTLTDRISELRKVTEDIESLVYLPQIDRNQSGYQVPHTKIIGLMDEVDLLIEKLRKVCEILQYL